MCDLFLLSLFLAYLVWYNDDSVASCPNPKSTRRFKNCIFPILQHVSGFPTSRYLAESKCTFFHSKFQKWMDSTNNHSQWWNSPFFYRRSTSTIFNWSPHTQIFSNCLHFLVYVETRKGTIHSSLDLHFRTHFEWIKVNWNYW